jgi:Uma2 family endonuclease
MSLLTPTAPITPEDFLHLSDAGLYELVDGRLVERHMGLESSSVAARILFLIALFLKDHPLGHLFESEASYQCFPHAPKQVRRADVSFIRAGRFEGDRLPKGHCRIAPDLVIEVVSPGDLAYEVEEKVNEYLQAGVPLIWVVYPPTRTVKVYRQPSSALGKASEFSADETVTGEEVLPGLSSRVSEFFV